MLILLSNHLLHFLSSFRGDECEDVHESIRNYKRAGSLNGWNEVNLALGFQLYLKGHASAWFKTLPTPDEMTFD